MQISALILAAGRGTRAGAGLPKQYRSLAGVPVLTRAMRSLLACASLDHLRVVIHPDDHTLYDQAVAQIADTRLMPPVLGGDSRAASVRAGLENLPGDAILVHDAARPLVPLPALERLIQALADAPAVLLALPVADALWAAEDGLALESQPREHLWAAQTPQGFHADLLRRAHQSPDTSFRDDAEAVRALGTAPKLVTGDPMAFKLTHPQDFTMAEALLNHPDVRTGTGYDVHQLGPGTGVVLNGIKIPFGQALKGHSDADVAMHAITDAIYGALAQGDIGQWFPPSDPQWKGAQSAVFLRHATTLAQELGYKINHLDCTIICELPKIGPHARAMREKLAEITDLDLDRISVKATTSEGLGFTGRAEGIAAQAVATVIKER